jgi:hypothetical protein
VVVFFEVYIHSQLTAQKLAKYDCELQTEQFQLHKSHHFLIFQTDNNPGFSPATRHFTQVSLSTVGHCYILGWN